MATYTVHKRDGDDQDSVELVREGFSLPAAVFTVLWALWHRAFVVALLLFAIAAASDAAMTALGFEPAAIGLAQAILALVVGAEAAALLRWSLKGRGFKEVATVTGQSREEAEIAFFAQHRQEPVPLMPVPSVRYRPADPLGLFGNV